MLSWVIRLFLVAFVVAAIFFLRSDYHKILLPTASGVVAKQMCSLTHVSGFTPERARALYIKPLIGDVDPFVMSRVDDETQSATASVLGLYRQEAVYREGLGCTLVRNDATFDRTLTVAHERSPSPLPFDDAHRAAHFDGDALDAALTAAFDEPPGGERHTLAVVVLHKGKLVAERYADDIDDNTLLHGWSMTKSMTATLAGAMTLRGEIDTAAPGTVPALTAAGGGKSEITINHLLRMAAGLKIYEQNNGRDPNSEMLFVADDMATFAATRDTVGPPGTRWSYQSGQTVLAMQGLQAALGQDLEGQVQAIRERIFTPLGIHGAIIEPDNSGTLVGSSYMYATAHDWARIAQLYVDNGMVGDLRILPETWREFVSTPIVPQYGVGFWLMEEGYDMPLDIFYMQGVQGQFGFIAPTEELVVIRLGATGNASTRAYSLLQSVLGSMKTPSPVPDAI